MRSSCNSYHDLAFVMLVSVNYRYPSSFFFGIHISDCRIIGGEWQITGGNNQVLTPKSLSTGRKEKLSLLSTNIWSKFQTRTATQIFFKTFSPFSHSSSQLLGFLFCNPNYFLSIFLMNLNLQLS